MGSVSEELLFLHVRAVIQVLDGIMQRTFDERLADHLPDRALPITTRPVQDFDVLVDSQYSQIRRLLARGKRRTPEARALIRGLLAIEGHVADDARVSERDVDRVVRGVREGASVEEVFPRLRTLDAATDGEGGSITVHFTKKGGAPVTFVPADDPSAAAAVRELDLQRKYHWTATALAAKLGLTWPKATALRRELGVDDNDACRHEFVFGAAKHVQYSDNAYRKMQKALDDGIDLDDVWARHGWSRRRDRAPAK